MSGEVGWAGGFVGAIGVFTKTAVDAGIKVVPECGSGVRGVAVSMKKRIGVEEGVVVNVNVGLGVTVRVFVMVGVGPVEVGKGPYSARDVMAIAVLVLLALEATSRPRTDGRLKVRT
jgi:hypothetical protein